MAENENSIKIVHTEEKPENGLINILANVVIPVLILNKLSKTLGPLNALLLALAFPIFYGIYDFIKRRKFNYFSLLGFLHVVVTGSFALLGLSGMWFSIKEAFFPTIIGVFVLVSAFSKKPFVKTLFLNPQLLQLDKIETSLNEKKNHALFDQLLKKSTMLLSVSFFFSALLNFALALHIFIDLDKTLDETQKALVLNDQIAKMTQYSFVVILIPSMIFLIFILWHLLRGIRDLTGLKTDEVLKNN